MGSKKSLIIPSQASINDEGALHLRCKEFLVCSDVHVPGHHEGWVNRLLDYRAKNRIKHIVIAGDFWNFDAISQWELKDKGLSLREELLVGRNLLERLSAQAHVYLVKGNHDRRIAQQLNHQISFAEWMETIYTHNMTVTDYDYLFVTSGNQLFRICHPSNYSMIKGRNAALFAQDLHMGVMMGHQHYLSISTNKTGVYICADTGCLCDKKKFLYKKSSTTRFPDWENGFFHVKEGKVHLISEYTF